MGKYSNFNNTNKRRQNQQHFCFGYDYALKRCLRFGAVYYHTIQKASDPNYGKVYAWLENKREKEIPGTRSGYHDDLVSCMREIAERMERNQAAYQQQQHDSQQRSKTTKTA